MPYVTKAGKYRSGSKPGPKPGRPKVAGSGRKPRDFKAEALQTIWRYVTDGLAGKAISCAGPTGKTHRTTLSQDNQVRLISTAWKKLEPDLNAQAIKTEATVEHVYKEKPRPRDLARSVLSILEAAKLADQPAEPPAPERETEPAYEPPPPQLLIGRDKYIELTPVSAGQPVTATEPAGPLGEQSSPAGLGSDRDRSTTGISNGRVAPPSSNAGPGGPPPPVSASDGGGETAPSPPPRKPEHADVIEVDSNASHIFYDEGRRKWAVFDSDNLLHGWKRDKAEALKRAAELPRGPGPWQAHPFTPQDAGSGWHERRDNRATISNGKLNVVRRMPRGAR